MYYPLFHFSPMFGMHVTSEMMAADRVKVTPMSCTSLLSRCDTNSLANSWWYLTLSNISQK